MTCHVSSKVRLFLGQSDTVGIRRGSLPIALSSTATLSGPSSKAGLFFQEVIKHTNPLPESDLGLRAVYRSGRLRAVYRSGSLRAVYRSGNGKETLGSSSLRVIFPLNLKLDEEVFLPPKLLSASYKAPVH